MPEAAEPPPIETESTLEDIFKSTMPTEEEISEKTPEKPVEKPVEKKVEKKEPEKKDVKKEEKIESLVPESIFGDSPLEKKEEPPKEPEPTPIPENIKSEKARESFQKLDQKRIEAEKALQVERQKTKEYEEKVAKGDPASQTRIKQLEEQIKGMDTLVQRASLQDHPIFQAKFVIPREQLLAQAKSAYQDSGGDPAEIEQALGLKGKARIDKLDEILGGVTSKLLAGKLEQSINNIDRLDTERDNVLKNAATINKQLRDNDQINHHKFLEEQAKQAKQDLQSAVETLRDKFGFEIFKTTDDPKYSWWNDEQKKMREESEKVMLAISDPKEMAIAAVLVPTAARYRTLFLQERKVRLDLQKKLNDYEGSEPSLGGERKGKSRREVEQEDEDMPLQDAILKSIKEAQGR